MLYSVLLFLGLCTHQVSLQTFDPGCSFSSGQCIYNVKLGHENQCDAGKRSTVDNSGTSSGLQSCSCKDVDGINNNVNSLWSTMTTLQHNFNALAKQLNVTQHTLGMKEAELSTLQGKNNNITALLADRALLLNKSQVDLANTVASMNIELERLRKELADTHNKLTVCRTTLSVIDAQHGIKPVLYGGYVTHYCDFEDIHNCNYTLDRCSSSASECWNRGTGKQNTNSGPVEDHTFGSPKGHYMFIDPYKQPTYSSSSATTHKYRSAKMTSPEFPAAQQYCVRFWYTMYGHDIGSLKVYAQVGGGNGYPVFQHAGQIDRYWHMVQISLDSEYTSQPFRIVMEGTTNSYHTYSSSSSHTTYNGAGYIAFDDMYVYNTSCAVIPSCPAGGRQFTDNNKTSCYTFHVTPMSWYDAVKECKSEAPNGHLVGVTSKREQDFIVDTVQGDASFTTAGSYGWYTSGNDERTESNFVWTNTGYPNAINYTDWHAGQPNNVGDIQNCLLLQYSNANYEWGDVNCDDKHPFICEIPM